MKLADALADIEAAPRGPRCTIGIAIQDMDDDDRNALIEALDNPRIATAKIVAALKAIGHDVNAHSLARHRRRADGNGCKCR